MNEEHKRILLKNLVALTKGLTLDEEFIANLQSSNVLTVGMVEELTAISGMTKRVSHFITMLLPRRGPRAFEEFIKTCVLTGQEWIADDLDPKLATKYRGQRLPRYTRETGEPAGPPSGGGVHTRYPAGGGGGGGDPPPFIDLRNPSQDEETPPDPMTNFIQMDIKNVNQGDPSIASLINNTNNVYKMSSDPRGKVVIINNKEFHSMSDRGGSDFDAVNLSELFRKLHFDVDMWTDVTAKEILQKLDAERQNPFLKDYDCYVMAILSHGNRGVIYGVDTNRVSIEDEIVRTFDSLHCPALAGKPKIFLIQACQGEAVTLGAPPEADSGPNDDSQSENSATNTPDPAKELEKKVGEMRLVDDADSVPMLPSSHEKADMLMAYSTVPGYKSWRNPEVGSWFMRDFISVVAHNAHRDHLADMLTQVGKRISDRSVAFKGFVQINETRTTLRKKLFFFPGYVQKC